MQSGQPSLTARAAAAHRAAHQVLEGGRIFADPLAARLLGTSAEALARDAAEHAERRPMRLFIAARSRVAEDAVAAAVARGVRQLVVLGAGLDTFAYRNPFEPRGLVVFEVDHPATQAWKRSQLAASNVPVPASLRFAPVDFERQTLADGLAAAGFDAQRAAIFTWLGVVPYLTRPAIFATLGFVASLAEAEVIFDYGEAAASLPPAQRAAHTARAARVAALGEPWVTYFEPTSLASELRGLGFTTIDDLGPAELGPRYFGVASIPPGRAGGHVIRAARGSVTE